MLTNSIPVHLAYAVSLLLAFHGFTSLTAPRTLIEWAVQQANQKSRRD